MTPRNLEKAMLLNEIKFQRIGHTIVDILFESRSQQIAISLEML